MPCRVLVTGGNKGIGYALCRQLVAERGCEVIMGSRSEERGQKAVASITQKHPDCQDKLHLLKLDVSDDASVKQAVAEVEKTFGTEVPPLSAIVNNAGVGFGSSMEETLQSNAIGTMRVCEGFLPLLDPKEGRIVNTASASGPNYVAGCGDKGLVKLFTDPAISRESLDSLIQDALANPNKYSGPYYGLSKAIVNSYTMLLAREHSNLKINSMTPGFIITDITRGMGATKTPEEGTTAAMHLLFGELEGNGRYYGSDAVRSPLDRYRGPGDPPYEGP